MRVPYVDLISLAVWLVRAHNTRELHCHKPDVNRAVIHEYVMARQNMLTEKHLLLSCPNTAQISRHALASGSAENDNRELTLGG